MFPFLTFGARSYIFHYFSFRDARLGAFSRLSGGSIFGGSVLPNIELADPLSIGVLENFLSSEVATIALGAAKNAAGVTLAAKIRLGRM